jgi:hypothetical protein
MSCGDPRRCVGSLNAQNGKRGRCNKERMGRRRRPDNLVTVKSLSGGINQSAVSTVVKGYKLYTVSFPFESGQ